MSMNLRSLNLPVRQYIQTLRSERKAALRECGRLGEKLHTSRLEIIVLRRRVKDLEMNLAKYTLAEITS